ncbi:MAG: redoxin domain-containing protein, partial [Pseudomonadales bacterium]|nr:redoxin domain-containing protein [Pseudomonadales bacterium]
MLKISSLAKLALAGTLAAYVCLPANAADRISDFSLVDHNGKFFQLSRAADNEAIVILSHEDSRDVRRAYGDLEELIEQFADQPVAFYLIDSTGASDKVEMRDVADDADIALPILMDDTQLVAKELGIARATDVVILDPESQEVVFRGALNDRWAEGSRSRRASEHYVADALTAFLAGNDIAAEQVASKGDAIEFATPDAVSYANDVAPILKERCVTCHMEGGIAPFAMTNHQMVQGWSPMIREVLYTKRMPPGQIGTEYVHDFRDVAHITVEETQKLVSWIEAGAQNNDGVDPLAEYNPELVKWSYGEPDLVYQIPAQQIPATGVQDYRNIAMPLNLEEDVWVKAIEFEAGDTTVLHHIIAFAYGPNGVNEFEILNQGI